MSRCDTVVNLKNVKLFKELVPNLQKLNLGRNYIKSLDADVFKHAEKLIELDLDLSKIENPIFRNETFLGLFNLRVLNVDSIILDSLEPFNCLSNLEELRLVVDRKSPIKKLDAFPDQLFKLRVLELDFRCEVLWVAPTVFDHLKCLERFEFTCFKWRSDIQMDLLNMRIAPRFLKVIGVKTLRLLGGECSMANIETIELFELNPNILGLHESLVTKLECHWPLSGLTMLNATLLNEKSLLFEQIINLEFLSLVLNDLSMLSRSGLDCLCNLKELKVEFNNTGL
jgi:hypothetical protein